MRDLLFHLLTLLRPFTVLRWTVYVITAAALWLIFDYPLLREYIRARQQRDQYKAQVHQEKQRQQALEAERLALRDGGFAAEKAIRERQRFALPGEKVIILETPKPQNDPS